MNLSLFKKATGIVVGLFLVVPSFASAITLSDLRAQVEDLLGRVYELRRSNSGLAHVLPTPAPTTVQQNILSNGSFESSKTGWNSFSGTKEIVSEDSSEGSSSLKFTLQSGSKKMTTHDIVLVTEGESYTIGASVKTTGVTGSGVRVDFEWRKKGGSLIKTDTFGPVKGTTNWTMFEKSVTAPTGAARLKIVVTGEKGTGTAYIDDVRLEVAVPIVSSADLDSNEMLANLQKLLVDLGSRLSNLDN